jgi:elongation factor Ts
MTGDIQKLREATGAGIMDCKRALDAARGDFTAAMQAIQAQGLAKAAAKSEKKTGAGVLEAYIHNGRIGVLLELRCETDFVARGDLFRGLARDIAMHISAMNPETPEALLAQPYVRDESATVADIINGVIAKTGENIKVERFARFEV